MIKVFCIKDRDVSKGFTENDIDDIWDNLPNDAAILNLFISLNSINKGYVHVESSTFTDTNDEDMYLNLNSINPVTWPSSYSNTIHTPGIWYVTNTGYKLEVAQTCNSNQCVHVMKCPCYLEEVPTGLAKVLVMHTGISPLDQTVPTPINVNLNNIVNNSNALQKRNGFSPIDFGDNVTPRGSCQHVRKTYIGLGFQSPFDYCDLCGVKL